MGGQSVVPLSICKVTPGGDPLKDVTKIVEEERKTQHEK